MKLEAITKLGGIKEGYPSMYNLEEYFHEVERESVTQQWSLEYT